MRNERLRRAAGEGQQSSRPDPEGQRSSTGGTIRQAVRTRLIVAPNQQISIPVTLRYSSDDPLAVHIEFPAIVSPDAQDMTWCFARDLMAGGICRPSGLGDVRIWPGGRAYTIMEFSSSEGRVVAKFDTPVLIRFLLRSYALVDHGREDVGPAIEEGLAALLDGV
ncbi:SsgA family sporulation/cell division regulator [Streptomyces sp. AK02-04a]|uniref:SsgA family sporulation/cell division regulator n=1 Tax=Streptomyces sp. AK02-04a TaxID=3028649 RepID=UPI0029AD5504|nr:SsgA family sporulation/cell division regulator [Streptomyces sp. AK02-04a]MDX3763405.1 SsgA family sporulation/cell division regulator [Streptomyces sp. AK02-04a]